MLPRFLFAQLIAITTLPSLAVDDYRLGQLSQEKPDVPKGKVISMPMHDSKIYAGAKRDWWVYVPLQYKPAQPANLIVFQDEHDYVGSKGAWRVPVVFDNLIASGEMQPTIAIFINPGHSGDTKPPSVWKNNNRGKEYNTLGDTYVRFLLEEILPQVQKDYKLTENPEGWAIAGASSGAICAFTGGVGTPGQVPEGILHHRQLCRSRRRACVSINYSSSGTQAAACLSARR